MKKGNKKARKAEVGQLVRLAKQRRWNFHSNVKVCGTRGRRVERD